jgi:hypothetical protein
VQLLVQFNKFILVQIADRGTDTIQIGSKWYTLSDDATVIGVDVDDDGNFGDVNAVRRLSAVRIDRHQK